MNALHNLFRITHREQHGQTYVVETTINANDALFDIHFPEMPIVPGACLVGFALEMLKQSINVAPSSSPVLNRAVFNQPVLPDQQLRLEIKIGAHRSSKTKVDCRFLSEGELKAQALFAVQLHEK